MAPPSQESGAINAVRVWFLRPENAMAPEAGRDGFKNKWSTKWLETTRLIPISSSEMPGGGGTASFKLLRGEREENGESISDDEAGAYPGAYVCITCGTDTFNAANAVWYGWVSTIDFETAKTVSDEYGTVNATGLGDLLDGTILTGWRTQSSQGSIPQALATPPTANVSSLGGRPIGNAILDAPTGSYVFARLPESCGTSVGNYWTRWRLLNHILTYCRPQDLPSITITCSAAIQTFLDDTSIPEVYDIYGITLKGALDVLLPRARGIGWSLFPDTSTAGTWVIDIYSHDCDGTYLPTNTPVDVDLTSGVGIDKYLKSVNFTESAADQYDQVVVRGAPIIYGVTVGVADGTLDRNWTDAQETIYRAGAKAATGYSGFVAAKQIGLNNVIRQGAYMERIFTAFKINSLTATASAGDLYRRNPPGTGAGNLEFLVPTLNWNWIETPLTGQGTGSIKIDTTVSSSPYIPTARIQRFIPWPKGVKADGTDSRDAGGIAQPEYETPKVFRYLSSGPAAEPESWVDLLLPSQRVDRGTPSVTPDERALGLRIKYESAPELLAFNHWAASDAITSLNTANPDSAATKAIDWKNLVATVGVESDQVVEVVVKKPGSDDFTRRQLIIKDEDLQCWVMMVGTILGLKPDATTGAPAPDYVTNSTNTGALDSNNVGVIIRNDYPTAQRIANMVSAWVFRRKISVSIKRSRPDLQPTYGVTPMDIGVMVGAVRESPATSTTCNTVIETIERDWSTQSPSITFTTSVCERPELHWKGFGTGSGSPSPQSGGQVSATLEGTTAQAVADLQHANTQAQRDSQHVPLIIGKSAAGASSFNTISIIGGNTLSTGQIGIKYSSSLITSVPSAYDPTVTTSFIDGIGRGTLFINGVSQGIVLVVNDTRGGAVTFDLLGTSDGADVGYAGSPVSIDVSGGGGTTVSAYPIAFL